MLLLKVLIAAGGRRSKIKRKLIREMYFAIFLLFHGEDNKNNYLETLAKSPFSSHHGPM